MKNPFLKQCVCVLILASCLVVPLLEWRKWHYQETDSFFVYEYFDDKQLLHIAGTDEGLVYRVAIYLQLLCGYRVDLALKWIGDHFDVFDDVRLRLEQETFKRSGAVRHHAKIQNKAIFRSLPDISC